MTERQSELEAQKIEDEFSNISLGDKLEAYTNETEAEEPKESMVPISELRKVRAEAAKYRKELQSLRLRIEEENRRAEISKMEEIDRLRAKASEAESQVQVLKDKLNKMIKETAIINAASSQGFYNPKDAASMIDINQIEIDDTGTIDENVVNELVKELAESKPYLKKESSILSYGPTNPPPQSGRWPKPKLTLANQIEQMKQQSRELTRMGRVVEATRLYNKAWEMEQNMLKKTE
ncbi:MAG: phage scaffolding protein [bacterium]